MVVWAPRDKDPQGDSISPFPAKSSKYGLTRISISQRMISCVLPKTKPNGDDLQSTTLRLSNDDDDDIKSKTIVWIHATKFEKCTFIFVKTFSLPLPSSLLKLPNDRKWTGGKAWAQLKIDWCIFCASWFDLQGLKFSSLWTEILYLSYELK